MTIGKTNDRTSRCVKDCFCCMRCAIYGADITVSEDRESYQRVVCEIHSLVPAARGRSCRHFEFRETSLMVGGTICR